MKFVKLILILLALTLNNNLLCTETSEPTDDEMQRAIDEACQEEDNRLFGSVDFEEAFTEKEATTTHDDKEARKKVLYNLKSSMEDNDDNVGEMLKDLIKKYKMAELEQVLKFPGYSKEQIDNAEALIDAMRFKLLNRRESAKDNAILIKQLDQKLQLVLMMRILITNKSEDLIAEARFHKNIFALSKVKKPEDLLELDEDTQRDVNAGMQLMRQQIKPTGSDVSAVRGRLFLKLATQDLPKSNTVETDAEKSKPTFTLVLEKIKAKEFPAKLKTRIYTATDLTILEVQSLLQSAQGTPIVKNLRSKLADLKAKYQRDLENKQKADEEAKRAAKKLAEKQKFQQKRVEERDAKIEQERKEQIEQENQLKKSRAKINQLLNSIQPLINNGNALLIEVINIVDNHKNILNQFIGESLSTVPEGFEYIESIEDYKEKLQKLILGSSATIEACQNAGDILDHYRDYFPTQFFRMKALYYIHGLSDITHELNSNLKILQNNLAEINK